MEFIRTKQKEGNSHTILGGKLFWNLFYCAMTKLQLSVLP